MRQSTIPHTFSWKLWGADVLEMNESSVRGAIWIRNRSANPPSGLSWRLRATRGPPAGWPRGSWSRLLHSLQTHSSLETNRLLIVIRQNLWGNCTLFRGYVSRLKVILWYNVTPLHDSQMPGYNSCFETMHSIFLKRFWKLENVFIQRIF